MANTRFVVAVIVCVVHCAAASCITESRSEWGANPPVIPPLNLTLPVPYVVIHHSYTPSACATREACLKTMKAIQNMHQSVNGWNDIGYNFAIGSDGSVYEGRGWDIVGAHAKTYNFLSVGICFIGDYRNELPPPSMLQAAHQLIACGVARGSIQANYTVVGHRQVRDTECPGGALFKEIQGWTHWRSVQDLHTPPQARMGVTDVVDTNNTAPVIMDNSTTPDIMDSNKTTPDIMDNSATPDITDNSTTTDTMDNSITTDIMDSSSVVPHLAHSNSNAQNITGNVSL